MVGVGCEFEWCRLDLSYDIKYDDQIIYGMKLGIIQNFVL